MDIVAASSVNRLGHLWKSLITFSHAKVVQIYGDFLGYFEIKNFK